MKKISRRKFLEKAGKIGLKTAGFGFVLKGKQVVGSIEHKGVNFDIYAPISEKKLHEFVKEMQLQNPIIDNWARISRVQIFNETGFRARYFVLGFTYTDLELSTGLFDLPKMHIFVGFHESAHRVSHSISNKSIGKYLAKIHSKYFKTLSGKARKSILNSYPREAEIHPFFSVFDETQYILKVHHSIGHPASNASELFASASTTMRHFPNQFIRRLQSLSKKNPEIFKDVIRTARTVIEPYRVRGFEKKIFSKKLLNYLKKA